MSRNIELAKKLLESKGYEVTKKSSIDANRVRTILRTHSTLMERLKK